MSTATLVSVDEYLTTTYRPDCDFVDGEVIERNLGRKDHSKLQGEVFAWFRNRQRELRLKAFPEQRIQVALRRYRIPDVCVVALPEPDEQIFTQPPYICIEVLSPDDSFPKLQGRLDDYLAMAYPISGCSIRHHAGVGRLRAKGISRHSTGHCAPATAG